MLNRFTPSSRRRCELAPIRAARVGFRADFSVRPPGKTLRGQSLKMRVSWLALRTVGVPPPTKTVCIGASFEKWGPAHQCAAERVRVGFVEWFQPRIGVESRNRGTCGRRRECGYRGQVAAQLWRWGEPCLPAGAVCALPSISPYSPFAARGICRGQCSRDVHQFL